MVVFSKKLRAQQYTEGQYRRSNLTLLITCSLFLIVTFSSCTIGPSGPPPPPPEYVCPTTTTHPITVNMVYDDTEQLWMDTAVKDFNSQRETACDGPITVQATPMGLGQSMQSILDGKLQPDVWNPGGSAWLSLLNTQWHSKNGQDLVDTTSTSSLISSPIVIAMWESEAQALGWPGLPVNWSNIASLISSANGWGSVGHPSWGKFKFGNTSLDYSNAGLEAIIGMTYAATCTESATSMATVIPTITENSSTCKKTGLTADDVNSKGVKNFITTVEKSAVYYDSTTTSLADQMFRRGPTYLNAVAAEESFVFQANDKTKYPNLPEPVVAVYPNDGTVVSDYPFAILHGSWLSPSKNAASLVFRDFLLSKSEQTKAAQDGFRPNPSSEVAASTNIVYGISAEDPKTVVPIPDLNVLQTIQANWASERRPFDIMLLMDASSGMNFSINNVPKIDGARQGMAAFTNKFMKDSDQLGLTAFFSDHIYTLSSVTPLGAKRQDFLSRINSIPADGGVLLFDSIAQQFKSLQQLPSTSIRAMIVLSNKGDTESTTRSDQLLKLITPPAGQDSKQNIRIFTIAYGSEADNEILTRIAQKTNGQEFSATPQNIQDVYQQIGELL